MATTDYIISDADKRTVHVEAQPTILRGSAQQNKRVFDKYSDLIVTRFNGLCTEVAQLPDMPLDTSAASGTDYELTAALTALGWLDDVTY